MRLFVKLSRRDRLIMIRSSESLHDGRFAVAILAIDTGFIVSESSFCLLTGTVLHLG